MKQILLVALVIPFIFISGYSQDTRFSINLPAGYRYSTESTVNLFVEQEYMGIRYNTKMEVNSLIYMQVQGLDADSNYILSASYHKMDIGVSSLLINMEVNSESFAPGDSLSLILHSLQGKEFKIFLSRNGMISDISGLDEMISETIDSSYLPLEQKTEFTRNLIQSLGEDVLLDNYSSNVSFYPGYKVKAPATWDFKYDLSKSGIPMELNSHIHLKSISGKMAIMVSEGTIGQQNKKKESDNLPAIDNISGNEVSEIKMDVKTGIILESIVSQNISGTLRTPSDADKSIEIIIPFKITSRRTARVVSLK